ncbi:MAG TPA: hypothetical protein VKV77_06065 [Methylovirgula sp.]|nr:hypothetical protein [Methylovirgula sp.]
MLADAIPVISALIALAGLSIAWRQSRESALRRADVLAWSNDVIRELQSLLLICVLGGDELEAATRKAKLTEILFNTSVLVERGRLFFRNEVRNDQHGQTKELAYRGYRPAILDQIVVAHQIARQWERASETERASMILLAEDCAKKFVSLAQQEVGRSKTASAVTKKGGDGRQLEDLLKDFNSARLEEKSSFARAHIEAAARQEGSAVATAQE